MTTNQFDISLKPEEEFSLPPMPGFFTTSTWLAKFNSSIGINATATLGLKATADMAITSPQLSMTPTTVVSGTDTTFTTTTNDVSIRINDNGFASTSIYLLFGKTTDTNVVYTEVPYRAYRRFYYIYIDGSTRYYDTAYTAYNSVQSYEYTERIMKSWIPFLAVNIAKATTIISATLKLVATDTMVANGKTTRIKFRCEDSADVVTPTSYSIVNGRPVTAEYVSATITSTVAGTVYSYDVTAPVQAIINKSTWASGNDLAIVAIDDGSDSAYKPRMASYDHVTYTAPQLTIRT